MIPSRFNFYESWFDQLKVLSKVRPCSWKKNANWLVMNVPKCITIQWYGVRNISAARRLILTPSTMHVCWENFKQNYKNFWQDLHNIKKYDSKICITFFLKSQKFFLAQVSKDFFFEFLPCISFKGFFLLAQVSKVFLKSFCLHKDFFLDVLLT